MLGVWELVLDAEGAIKDIWCMRQLTDAEKQRVVCAESMPARAKAAMLYIILWNCSLVPHGTC